MEKELSESITFNKEHRYRVSILFKQKSWGYSVMVAIKYVILW